MTTTASAGGWSVRVEIERHGADLEVPEHPHFAQLTYRGAPIGVLQRRHHEPGLVVSLYREEGDRSAEVSDVPEALAAARGWWREMHPEVHVAEPISGPGVYADVPELDYHRDLTPHGSLSYSAAKVLLDEAGPARFAHARTAARPYKHEYSLGSAAHAILLGKGSEALRVIDARDWRTAAAREQRDKAMAAGLTPLLPHELTQAEEIAAGIDRVPLARELLTGGTPEVSLYAEHRGILLRGRLDYLTDDSLVDVKTTNDADTRPFERSIWSYRYYMQAAWYRRLYTALTGTSLPWHWVILETAPPYLPAVRHATDEYLTLGELHMDRAIDTYLACRESGIWPGYPDQSQPVDPPAWARAELLNAEADDVIAALTAYLERP